MKIIHTGDLHLNSPLNSSYPCDKAIIRSNEILQTFKNTVAFANDNDIKIIIIAGDFFDCNKISAKTEKFVFDVISSAKNIDFLYLKGNHDDFIRFKEEFPDNLIILKDGEKHFYENICICGLESCEKIDFDIDSYNIAVMHGELINGYDKYQVNLKALENKNIDYLALGHIHKGGNGIIDKRGKYAYCGNIDGRGFDELGEKGFLVLNTDNGETEFVKMSSRTVFQIKVDITDISSNYELIEKVEKSVSGIDEKSIIQVILTGEYTEGFIKDIPFVEKAFDDKFFYLGIKDESRLKINYSDYENDISLKGEFIRLVRDGEIPEDVKEKVILVGLNALDNEDLGL